MRTFTVALLCSITMSCCSCARQHIAGGQSEHTTLRTDSAGGKSAAADLATEVSIEPGRVLVRRGEQLLQQIPPTLHSSTERIASTQATVESVGEVRVHVDSADEGELAGVSIKSIQERFKARWPLGLTFVLGGGAIAAVGFYFAGPWVGLLGAAVALLGVLLIMAPLPTTIALAIGFALILWQLVLHIRHSGAQVDAKQSALQQIVAGVDKGMGRMSPVIAQDLKRALREEDQGDARREVAAIKGKAA